MAMRAYDNAAWLVTIDRAAGRFEGCGELQSIAQDVLVGHGSNMAYLIYYDPLTAYKVAAVSGGTVSRGRVQADIRQQDGLHFPGGHVFVAATVEVTSRPAAA